MEQHLRDLFARSRDNDRALAQFLSISRRHNVQREALLLLAELDGPRRVAIEHRLSRASRAAPSALAALFADAAPAELEVGSALRELPEIMGHQRECIEELAHALRVDDTFTKAEIPHGPALAVPDLHDVLHAALDSDEQTLLAIGRHVEHHHDDEAE